MKRLFPSSALWVAVFLGLAVSVHGAEAAKSGSTPADKPAAAAPDKALTLSGSTKADPGEPAPGKADKAAPLAPETVLVTVDDKTITQGELDEESKAIEKMMIQRGLSEKQFAAMLSTFKPQILDGLVTQALIDNECAARKIQILDADVKKEIDGLKANLPKSQTLEAMLEKQGMTQSVLEEQIKDQLKVEKLLNITVSDKDVQDFYNDNKGKIFETVRARHILIKVDPTDDAAKKTIKKEKAEKLRKQLVDGADFAKLAKENSDCPSKENGGELIPPFRRGAMTKPFEDVAFSLKPNEISQVVETDFGYHIIQTLEHQTQSFDEVKGRIMAMLKGRKTQQQAEPFIKNLKAKAKISYQHGATPPPEVMFPPSDNSAPSEPQTLEKPESKTEEKPAATPVVKDVAAPSEKKTEKKASFWDRLKEKFKDKPKGK